MLRNRKADEQELKASEEIKNLRSKLEEARRFWRESIDHDLAEEIVSGNFRLYEEAVAEYNAQCKKECLFALERVAN